LPLTTPSNQSLCLLVKIVTVHGETYPITVECRDINAPLCRTSLKRGQDRVSERRRERDRCRGEEWRKGGEQGMRERKRNRKGKGSECEGAWDCEERRQI
jgi:hypothetical protein